MTNTDENKVNVIKNSCKECKDRPVIKHQENFMCAKCFAEWLTNFWKEGFYNE